MIGISIWVIDMGGRTSMDYRYEYRYGIRNTELGYCVSIWLSTISMWYSWISVWDMG